LNFIDWDNEYDAILEAQCADDFESPIPGIDAETFERIYDEYFEDDIKQHLGVNKTGLKRVATKTVNKVKKENVCAICLVAYRKGNKIVQLGCEHHFHSDCIKPWFDKNHVCPTCRFDINKGRHQNEGDYNDKGDDGNENGNGGVLYDDDDDIY